MALAIAIAIGLVVLSIVAVVVLVLTADVGSSPHDDPSIKDGQPPGRRPLST